MLSLYDFKGEGLGDRNLGSGSLKYALSEQELTNQRICFSFLSNIKKTWVVNFLWITLYLVYGPVIYDELLFIGFI